MILLITRDKKINKRIPLTFHIFKYGYECSSDAYERYVQLMGMLLSMKVLCKIRYLYMF